MMNLLASLALAVGFQVVPPPSSGPDAATALRVELRTIRETEAAKLDALARAATEAGRAGEAAALRAWIEPPAPPNGPERFVPLPEFSAPEDDTPADPELDLPEARKVRAEAVESLMALARQAAEPGTGRYALAITCLRAVLERDLGHREARRLIGYVEHEGGWATPHAAENLKGGYVLHPTFGWVRAGWVENLEQGKLPGIINQGRPVPWLPAADADGLRRDFFRRPWQISTEHFDIATNVPLAEAIAFGRRLEAVRDVFMTLFADVLGAENLDIDDRFRDPNLWASPSRTRHAVWYFANRSDYLGFFKKLGRDESISLGYYMPAAEARRVRLEPRCYVFRNEGDPLNGLPTLFHEASHQLLFELAGPTQFERNVGQYWIWEGLGTYFETFTPRPDGSYEIGGLVGPRIAKARSDILDRGIYAPIAELTAMSQVRFQDSASIISHYAEAMALVVFLMHADDAAYRDSFLDYVTDAYRGRFRPGGAARWLTERLDVSAEQLDEQFKTFLAAGGKEIARGGSDQPALRRPGGNLALPDSP